MRLTRPVFLIGFMGAGKSSVARAVARKVGIMEVDADNYLERSLGETISQIFEERGEEAFRVHERDVLDQLSSSDREPMLIACGGGVIQTPESRALLTERGFVIHLHVDPQEAAMRINDTSTRPLFQDADHVAQLWQTRQPLYQAVADVSIETRGRAVNDLASEVIEILRSHNLLIDGT